MMSYGFLFIGSEMKKYIMSAAAAMLEIKHTKHLTVPNERFKECWIPSICIALVSAIFKIRIANHTKLYNRHLFHLKQEKSK